MGSDDRDSAVSLKEEILTIPFGASMRNKSSAVGDNRKTAFASLPRREEYYQKHLCMTAFKQA